MTDKEPKAHQKSPESDDGSPSSGRRLPKLKAVLANRKVQITCAIVALGGAAGVVGWKYWPRTRATTQVAKNDKSQSAATRSDEVKPIPGKPLATPADNAGSSAATAESSVMGRLVSGGQTGGGAFEPADSGHLEGSEIPTIPPTPPSAVSQTAGIADGGSFSPPSDGSVLPSDPTPVASLTDQQPTEAPGTAAASLSDQGSLPETQGESAAPPADPLASGGSFPDGGSLPDGGSFPESATRSSPASPSPESADALPSPPADLTGPPSAASGAAPISDTEVSSVSDADDLRPALPESAPPVAQDNNASFPPTPPAELTSQDETGMVPVRREDLPTASGLAASQSLPTAPPVAAQVESSSAFPTETSRPPAAPSTFGAGDQPAEVPQGPPTVPDNAVPSQAAPLTSVPSSELTGSSSVQPPPSAPRQLQPQGGAAPTIPAASAAVPSAAGSFGSLGAPTTMEASPSTAPRMAALPGGAVRDTPGPRTLEGAQTPAVTLHKVGPREVQVNRPATFKIVVRNTGRVPVRGVMVRDRVPRGTRLVRTIPPARELGGGELEWQFDSLDPGAEAEISMELIPETEGEIGSVATVHFAASATARAVSTRPVLRLALSGPRTVLLGNRATLDISVTNEGTGAAEGVLLQADVPEVLRHEKGQKLEYEIGTMAPGESRRLTLVLQAVAPGRGVNQLMVQGKGDLVDRQELDVEVVAPKLVAAIDGPKRRFLERKAEYRLQIGNAGTAPAKNVSLTLQLPKGMQFIEAGVNGQYDTNLHVVRWNLEELPPQQQGEAKVVVMPVDTGAQLLRMEATAPLSEPAVYEHQVTVEALSELTFTVADSADPIELNSETVYEVKIRNQGSRPDTNIQLQVSFPAAIQAIEAEGASQASAGQDGSVAFAPVERLAPGEELIYRIRARGVQAGSHLVQAKVTSDQAGVLVTKEEQTRVYVDR